MSFDEKSTQNQVRTIEIEYFFSKNVKLSNRDRKWLRNKMKAFDKFEEGKSPFYNQNEYSKDLLKIKRLFTKVLGKGNIEMNQKKKLKDLIDSIRDSNDIYFCYEEIRKYCSIRKLF